MRASSKTGWKVYALRTTTGEVGSEYSPVAGSWSIELNKIEDFSITVKKKDLLKRERLWWYPWSGGVLFTYTGEDGIEHPVVAGPIHDYGTETTEELQLSCAGIRKIFEHRVIDKNVRFEKMTYGDMSWRLIQLAMDKPGGSLPIVHGIPEEEGRFEKSYEGWNLANNAVDKLLTERSELINGPDMMFRPRWVPGSNKRRIEWVFVHGTQLNPLIPQSRQPDFDTTTTRSEVAAPSIKSSGEALRHRIWYTGAGEGEGIARTYAENLKGVENGQPFLETVASEADQASLDKLFEKAQGLLAAQSQMIDQLTFKTHARSKKNPLGSFFVGDIATVTLKDWITIPDGSREMTIIKMNGSLSDEVTIDFQEDSW